jgi:putative AlgH/UPF0301 family transcriptional regulator
VNGDGWPDLVVGTHFGVQLYANVGGRFALQQIDFPQMKEWIVSVVALVDLDGDPDALAPRVRGVRVFAGYAGWSAGQLAGEIGRGDWFVVPALPDDVLAPPRYDLWGGVLRRQGVPLALMATHVADVKRN